MTARAPRQSSRGATMMEMVLVGIPMVFMLICIFEISRGMWIYATEAYAAKEGVRYAIVHGVNCVTAPNNCPATISDVAKVVLYAGVGLDQATTTLTFTTLQDLTATTCTLATCLTTVTQWPPATNNDSDVGKGLRIDISTPFHSALGMFWPGSSPVLFAPVTFGASSTDYIQF